MKKLIILSLSLLFVTGTLLAQKKDFNYYYNKRVHFGIKGGANLTKIVGRGFNEQFKFSFHAGGFVQLRLTRTLGIQGEVSFDQSRADTARDFSEVVDYVRFPESFEEVKLDKITIPVLLNIGVGPVKALKVQVGPQYSLLINKSTTLLQNGQQAFKTGEFSLVGGLWLQLPVVNIGARYIVGLDNLNNVTTQSKWNSQTLQFHVGITF
jgi:Outer membrane protein beta-barrel domain